MDVLAVGTLAFDSVDTPAGARTDVLGGSGSFLATAAAYFSSVGLAGVVGADFPATYLDFFRGRGIDVKNVQQDGGKTFRWKGHYAADMASAQTLETELNVLKTFDPQLDAQARRARYVVLGNIDPALQSRVLDQIEAPAFVALDTMNYWIERHRDALDRALARVDLLCINEAEARQLSGEYDLVAAARRILAMGPANVVIKRGGAGALYVSATATFTAPAYPLAAVRDPTGAGDSFLGSLVGFLARRQQTDADALRHAVVVGTVMASFAIEDFSLDRLRTLDGATLAERVQTFYRATCIDADKLRWT